MCLNSLKQKVFQILFALIVKAKLERIVSLRLNQFVSYEVSRESYYK